MPSLSVVHTEPSRRRNDAPALSSPHEPMRPTARTNHLNPTGTSTSWRPRPAATRSMIPELTAVLPMAMPRPARPVREQVVDGHRQVVVGVQQAGVRGDDAVPVGVGVVTGGDLVAVPVGR